MDVPYDYSSSIDYIEKRRNLSNFFISTWENDVDNLDFLKDMLVKAQNNSYYGLSKYFFSDELAELKNFFLSNTAINQDLDIKQENIFIGNNGTITSYLVLETLCRLKRQRVLLLSPIYYTYINILKDLCEKQYFIEIIKDDVLYLDFEYIEKTMLDLNISMVILTDPIFGTGISLDKKDYDKLSQICINNNAYLLIDYIYGGQYWKNEKKYLKNYIINLATKYDKIIIIESLTKNLLLNGAKSCCLYSEKSLVESIELKSTYMTGSLTAMQLSLFKEIYDIKNFDTINAFLKNNIKKHIKNYNTISDLINTSNFIISNIDAGNFCLVGIPFINGKNVDEMMTYIFEETEVLLIPHDRYLIFNSNYFLFRVNLSLDINVLLTSFSRLKNLFK